MKNEFDIIAISETWCNDYNININSPHQMPNYTPIHQIRKTSSKLKPHSKVGDNF